MDAVKNNPVVVQQNKAEAKPAPKNAEPKETESKKQKDLFNDTILRKAGFLDEYGAALRPVLSCSKSPVVRALPNLAYIPATAYILADVADKYQKGEDGTGKIPSVKMAAREAAYQGVVSILAPIGIVKGVNTFTKNMAASMPKPPKFIQNSMAGALKNLNKEKGIGKILTKAGMPAKIAGAAISIFALSKLSKPVDYITGKFFDKVVDPLIGVNKGKNKEESPDKAANKAGAPEN